MLTALGMALIPVVAGLGLAALPGWRREWLWPARWVALIAGLAVSASLVAHAWESFGPAALLVFVAAAGIPWLVEQIPQRLGHSHSHSHDHWFLAEELGYWGLVLHQAVDGFEVGTADRLGQGIPVAVAIGLHSLPLVALVGLGFVQRGGSRRLSLRGFGLVAATSLGVAAGTGVVLSIPESYEAAIQACVAGLLMHILFHDVGHELLQRIRGPRANDETCPSDICITEEVPRS